MASSGFPFEKLVTPFGFAAMLGAPAALAGAVQAAAAIALTLYVSFVWRRVHDADLRLATLSTAALMATPYAFYYEFVIALPAMLVIAKRAAATGWLKHEKLSLIALWLLTMQAPGDDVIPSISVCAAAAFVAFAIVARRAVSACGIRFASAGSPAAAD
jgi:hypothetical protein